MPKILLIITLMLFGCTDYSRDIDEVYRFIKLDSDNHVIVNKKEQIVYQDVIKYKQNDKYIVGLKEASKHLTNSSLEWEEEQAFGYFVLEKDSGKLSFFDKKDFFAFVQRQQINW